MGLVGVWNTNFLGATVAVLPYEQYLKRFPAYLQQLTMESKRQAGHADGAPVSYDTGPIYWGEPGTNGQHSFYQLIHQGTRLVPCDFIAFGRSLNPLGEHHDLLLANVFARRRRRWRSARPRPLRAEACPGAGAAQALQRATGRRTRCCWTLTPANLGKLVALYEHRLHPGGAIWQLNPFDQWGVRTRQGARQAHRARACRRRHGARPRQLDERADPRCRKFRQA